MSTGEHEPGEDAPSSPHTVEHMTADTEVSDRDPEVEVQQPPRRRKLEEAAEAFADDEEEEEEEGREQD